MDGWMYKNGHQNGTRNAERYQTRKRHGLAGSFATPSGVAFTVLTQEGSQGRRAGCWHGGPKIAKIRYSGSISDVETCWG
jgi:hypothetical protein